MSVFYVFIMFLTYTKKIIWYERTVILKVPAGCISHHLELEIHAFIPMVRIIYTFSGIMDVNNYTITFSD